MRILPVLAMTSLMTACAATPDACLWLEAHKFKNPETLTRAEKEREAAHNAKVEEFCR